MKQFLIFKLFVIVIYLKTSNQFNVSPVPNYAFKEPDLLTGTKFGSSLFGFSITLRQSSIIVGAPKAQSDLIEQRNVNETGAIYKCTFTDKTCKPFVFDRNGNLIEDSLDSRLKDNQLLGFAVDGLGNNDQKLIVCAPHMKSTMTVSRVEEYYLHGVCYWTGESSTDPPRSRRITALKNKDLQSKKIGNKSVYYHWLGEMGFSVHITDNNKEMLMGAPGINNWQGSVVHYKYVEQTDNGTNTGESTASVDENKIIEVDATETGIDEDSYLGYAVDSGYFLSKTPNQLYYVSSAPQATQQSGRVYIFSIDKVSETSHVMKTHKQFDSTQMGEYFGYSILVEDFNNDKLPDIAIGAPLFTKTGFEENGAVYVYLNKDHWSFELQGEITSQYELSGRFGSSLGKIGDINLDGFNDIAVGAPFEDQGAVYIYLGSNHGLNLRKPSQRITPSKNFQIPNKNLMFGHSISRGVDIDQNEYNDIAIGAPAAEQVFVYRTYPVGKIDSTMRVSKRELKENDRTVKVTTCWIIKSATPVRNDLGMTVILKADYLNNRAKWQDNQNSIYETNVTISGQSKCYEFDLLIEYNPALVFRPIDIEMEYSVHDQATNSQDFCSTCVKFDSTEINYQKETIIYSTGCAGTVCVADLSVKSSLINLTPPLILGAVNTITVKYDVQNTGEPAYLPQINITLDNNIATFARIPSSCKFTNLNERELVCDLTKGNPIKTNEVQTLIVSIDGAKLEGDQFSITAVVSSSGNERNQADNRITDQIALNEFSHVEIAGKSSLDTFTLENIDKDLVNIVHKFEIINHGPSTLREMSVHVFVPTKYRAKDKKNAIQLIDINELSIQGIYNGQRLQWTPFSVAMPASGTNGRSKRDVKKTRKSKFALDELPAERTIKFLCDENGFEDNLCMNSYANLKNFLKGNDPIVVSLNFTLKIKSFENIFHDAKDIFILQTIADVKKPINEKQENIKVDAHQPYTVVFKHVKASTPIWVIIVSVLAGVLLFALVTYGLYKIGFFKRKRNEDRMNQNGEEMELKGPNNDNE
uniref:CSON000090 protein n=1 Tax=Culicoides sonorensis TaxID=179676 RepID=A0A336LTI8_CULSO